MKLSAYSCLLKHALTSTVIFIITSTLLHACSDSDLQVKCKSDETKKDGECVKNSKLNAEGTTDRPAGYDPTDTGDEVDTSVLSYDADTATFSIPIAKLNLTGQDKKNLIDAYKKPKNNITFHLIANGWKENTTDKLDAYLALSTKLLQVKKTEADDTPDGPEEDVDFNVKNEIKHHLYILNAASSITDGTSIYYDHTALPDCMALPNFNRRNQNSETNMLSSVDPETAELTAKIHYEKDDTHLKLKFVKLKSNKKYEADEEAIDQIKYFLGLKGYTKDDISFSIPEFLPSTEAKLNHPRFLLKRDQLSITLDNYSYFTGQWKGKANNDDKTLCFNKLFAKQRTSLNNEAPSESAKIFAYKEMLYKLNKNNNKRKFDNEKNEQKYSFDDKANITFTIDNQKEVKISGHEVFLGLQGAAYLINASADEREDYSDRAAPDETQLLDVITKLAQSVAANNK